MSSQGRAAIAADSISGDVAEIPVVMASGILIAIAAAASDVTEAITISIIRVMGAVPSTTVGITGDIWVSYNYPIGL
jgi:hypothetical protein